jgi:hypothetical protein
MEIVVTSAGIPQTICGACGQGGYTTETRRGKEVFLNRMNRMERMKGGQVTTYSSDELSSRRCSS